VSLLIGALGAAVIGVIGAAAGALIQSRREHKKWLREKRYDAYLDLLRQVDRKHITGVLNRGDFGDASAAIGLLGPTRLVEALEMFLTNSTAAKTEEQHEGVRQEFIETAQDVLEISRRR
jgi:hypothetical protein